MSLTLLVENNPQFQSFYVLNLYTWLGLTTKTVNTVPAACDFLETNSSDIKLIITRASIEKAETAKEIIEYLKKNDLSVPVIVIGPGKEFPGSFAHVPNSLELKFMIQSSAKALGITAKDMSLKVVPEYFPIPISYFKILKRPVCPVYSFAPGEQGRFQLLFQKLQEFAATDIDQMITDGMENLFVRKLDRLEFVNNVTSELMSLLKFSQLSEDEQITASDKSLELASKKLMAIGITEETVALAKRNIEVMKRNVKSSPQLLRLLNRLLKNKASYMFLHTQVLTYVSLHIVSHIDWGTPEQQEKMAFIAFFHDIALENDTQAKLKSRLELKKSAISDAEKATVEKHAQVAAELVVKFPHAPMGADQIIRQHHGMLNGVGFSEGISGNISPMSAVFIIAEDFTRIMLDSLLEKPDRDQVLKSLRDEYPNARFKKVIDTLEKITF